MFNEIADFLLELILNVGIPSPDALEKQRRASLVAGGVALVVNATVLLLFSRPAEIVGWSVVAVATLAAGWV